MIVTNSFSLNMLDPTVDDFTVAVERISVAEAREYARKYGVESAIGHADTARMVDEALEFPVQPNRRTITLRPGDWVMVAQYIGPRLPEGCTTLPAGARIDFAIVSIAEGVQA